MVLQIELIVVFCWRLANVLGLLRHSLVVVFLVVVVDCCQVVLLAVDLWQVHVHVDVVDADFGAMRRLGVRDSCCLCDVADHIHLHAIRRLTVVGRTALLDDLGAWDSLEICSVCALCVSGPWQAQLENVLLEFDRPQKLRIVRTTSYQTIRVVGILEEARHKDVLAPREVLTNTLDHDRHLEDLVSVGSLSCLHLQQRLDQHSHVH